MKILHFDCDNYPPVALEKLRGVGTLVCANPQTSEEARELIRDANILVVRMNHFVDRALIDAAPRLRIVATATTGLNHIDRAALKERNIALISLQGERDFLMGIRSTPELTFGLILALLRNIPAAADDVKNRHWDNNAFQGRELYGKTLGLVGFGRVGTIMARIAQGFGMHVLACDPYIPAERFTEENAVPASLPELLGKSDIVSIHAAFTPETGRLIGHKEFDAMQQGAYLVNTARGEIIDEQALLVALESDHLAGAALDVLTDEHRFPDALRDHPLVRYASAHSNLIIVPHIGGMARESVERTSAFIAEKVVDALKS